VATVVEAGVAAAFAAATDWPAQRHWIPLTTVRVVAGDGQSVGTLVHAFTGVGRIGFLDVFRVTAWEPPHRVDVLHLGRLVRGPGSIRCTERAPGRTEVRWSEYLHPPFGRLGRLSWPLVRPLAVAGLRAGLRRFARWLPTQAVAEAG
jgi:hypothetical protein